MFVAPLFNQHFAHKPGGFKGYFCTCLTHAINC